MNYRTNPKNGDKLSILGFGCMRFAKDFDETEKQIIAAIEQGVNYFDTAYIYPKSEETLGKILAKGYRDHVKIATKLPTYLVKKPEDLDKLFYTQLKRLQTNYIDYYFIHMLLNTGEWQRLCDLGILEWIEAKKSAGEIINIGFSYHGGLPEFKKLVDIYPWEFCMLQYNYYDENNQTGVAGIDYAAEKGLPVMVMEPLRGGKLAQLPEDVSSIFDQSPVKRSSAEWALRYVWNNPNVLLALSGMNSIEMVEENIRIASASKANGLTPEDLSLYAKARQSLAEKTFVSCTGCNYCMPCPAGVDIPLCFNSYNDLALLNPFIARFYYIIRTYKHNASLCIECGKCETHCPQKIEIRKELKATAKTMESFPYKPARFVISKFMRLK